MLAETLTIEVAVEIAPGVTAIVGFGVVVIGELFKVALIVVAVPAIIPVNEAV
jgi:hypothetical protein